MGSSTMSAIIIKVNSDIIDLIPRFLDNRRREISKLREDLRRSDFKSIYIIGHNLAGTGSGYGFVRLTEIGRIIESAAKAEDSRNIQTAVDELESFLSRVEVVND
jgi:hypothetical protein